MPKFPFLYLVFLFMLFSSCSNLRRSVSSKVIQQPDRAVDNLIILFTEYPDEIPRLDKVNYDKAMKNKFNNLEFQRFRNQMADESWDVFFPLATYDYRRIFEDHKEYTFEGFQEKLHGVDVDYIMLINMKVSEPIGNAMVRRFQVYLIDIQTGEHVWSSYGYSDPVFWEKKAARRLLKSIKKSLASDGVI